MASRGMVRREVAASTASQVAESLALGLGGSPRRLASVGSTGSRLAVQGAASTFSGWAFPVGVRQGFNRVTLEVYADDAADLPEFLALRIRRTNNAGAIVAGPIYAWVRSPQVARFVQVSFNLPATVANAEGDPLWVEVCGNGKFRLREVAATTYPEPTYPRSQYTVSQTMLFAGMGNTSSQRNGWFEFELVQQVALQQVGVPEQAISASGTFTGWGFPVGTPTPFSLIEFAVQPWDASRLPNTCRVRVRQTDHAGAVLADVVCPMAATAGRPALISARLPQAVGDGATALWIEYLTDGRVGFWGSVVASPASPLSRYSSGDQGIEGTLNAANASQRIGWFQLSNPTGREFQATPAQVYAALNRASGGSQVVTPYTPQLALAAPPYLYALEGREANCYWSGMVRGEPGIDWSQHIDVTCAVGKQERWRWTYVPGLAEAGTQTWACTVRWNNAALASSGNKTLRIADSAAGAGVTRKVLVIGDSTTANNIWVDECKTLFDAEGGGGMGVTFVGTQGTANKHEGRSGWTLAQYVTTGSPFVFSGSLDFAQYLSANSISLAAGDWVLVHVFINGLFSQADNSAATNYALQMVSDLTALIASIQAAVSGVRVGVCLTIPCAASQDAFGDDYASGQTRAQYVQNAGLFRELAIETWGSSEGVGVYLVPLSVAVDDLNNFPVATVAVNSRNATTVTRQDNGVHPDTSGYQQMADAIRAFLKWHA